MEDVDFSLLGPDPGPHFPGAVVLPCLALVAFALFAAHVRRPGHGAWTGTGLYFAALLPAFVGLGWTLFTFNTTIEHAIRMGMESRGPFAACAAEALFTTALGVSTSAAIVASMYLLSRRFPAAESGDSTLPGTWLLGCVLGGVFLAQGGVLLIAMQLMVKVVSLDALHVLIRVLALGVAALVIVALAAIRRAPRGRAVPRRGHAVVAGTLVALLTAAGTLTWVAVEHSLDVSRHG